MGRSDHDFLFLKRIPRVLTEQNFPSEVISELYKTLYGDTHPPKQLWRPEVTRWESVVIARAIPVIGEIVSKYVQLYHDPRELPVTHYWKQKQIAILLDEIFSAVLWEAMKRSADQKNGYQVYEETEKDEFLDKPILFLKEEARNRVFWNIKKLTGLQAIQERFFDQVRSRGIRLEKLEQEDFHEI